MTFFAVFSIACWAAFGFRNAMCGLTGLSVCFLGAYRQMPVGFVLSVITMIGIVVMAVTTLAILLYNLVVVDAVTLGMD